MECQDAADEIALAWRRERPSAPTDSIDVVTRIWHLATLFGAQRRKLLSGLGVDMATLDLLSTLRRSGAPYCLTTREIAQRTMVTAGAVSQRVARAEREGLVTREPGSLPRSVTVSLTKAGHHLVESTVDQLLTDELELISGLSTAQRTQLAQLLKLLLADVHTRVGPTAPTHVGSV